MSKKGYAGGATAFPASGPMHELMTNLRLSVSYLDLHSQLAEGSRHNSRCAMASVAVAVRAAGGGPQRVARVIAAPSREETGEECAEGGRSCGLGPCGGLSLEVSRLQSGQGHFDNVRLFFSQSSGHLPEECR